MKLGFGELWGMHGLLLCEVYFFRVLRHKSNS